MGDFFVDHPIITIGGSMLFIVLACLGITYFIDKPIDESNCYKFSEISGYETKFVTYTGSWDCLAKTDSGKWISTSLLREVDQ